MRMSGKKILVIIIMVVLISSVVAGTVSFFNKPSTSANNSNNAFVNDRLNQVIDFCLRSLPNGTSVCDSELLPVVNKLCTQDAARRMMDACTDGKVQQYYEARGIANNKTIQLR
jgi:hypothetical protein